MRLKSARSELNFDLLCGCDNARTKSVLFRRPVMRVQMSSVTSTVNRSRESMLTGRRLTSEVSSIVNIRSNRGVLISPIVMSGDIHLASPCIRVPATPSRPSTLPRKGISVTETNATGRADLAALTEIWWTIVYRPAKGIAPDACSTLSFFDRIKEIRIVSL